MSTYLVIGASRGIGLGFIENLSADPQNTVVATVRKGSDLSGIEKFSNVKLVYVDVSDSYEDIEKAFADLESLTPNGIDVVIHSAGINYDDALKPLQYQAFEQYSKLFEVNATGVVKVYKAIFNRLEKNGKPLKYAVVSSLSGKISDLGQGYAAYGASKAATNYFVKQIAGERKEKGDIVVPIHPGLVATDMGRQSAIAANIPPEVIATFSVLQPAESAKNMLSVIDKLTVEDTGKFFDHEGTTWTY